MVPLASKAVYDIAAPSTGPAPSVSNPTYGVEGGSAAAVMAEAQRLQREAESARERANKMRRESYAALQRVDTLRSQAGVSRAHNNPGYLEQSQ